MTSLQDLAKTLDYNQKEMLALWLSESNIDLNIMELFYLEKKHQEILTLQENCAISLIETRAKILQRETALLSLAKEHYEESAPSVFNSIKEIVTNATNQFIKDEEENNRYLVWKEFLTSL